MSDRFQTGIRDALPADLPELHPLLPPWLVSRLLREDEKITWVCGPKFNPPWERYITHPALFLVALALGAVCLAAGWLITGTGVGVEILPAGAIVIGSIFVLGLSNGYFTRLVVTNLRLVIMQGYEVCRSWDIDDLPRRLIRYRTREGAEDRAIDLDAMKTMLGSTSDKFAESKTILAFSKQLDRIKSREDRRP
jgi:hypothetical protein